MRRNSSWTPPPHPAPCQGECWEMWNGQHCNNQWNSVDVDVFSFFLLRGNALRQGSVWRGSRGPVALLLLVTLSLCGAAVWLYVTSLDSDITETLVNQAELVLAEPRVYTIQCSEDYEHHKRYPGEALFLVSGRRLTPRCCVNMTGIGCNRACLIDSMLIQKHVPHVGFCSGFSVVSHDVRFAKHRSISHQQIKFL